MAMDKRSLLIVLVLGLQGCVNDIRDMVGGGFIKDSSNQNQMQEATWGEQKDDPAYVSYLQRSIQSIIRMEENEENIIKVDAIVDKASLKNFRTANEAGLYNQLKLEAENFKNSVKSNKVEQLSGHKFCISKVCIGNTVSDLIKQKHKWHNISKESKENAIKYRKFNKDRYKAPTKTLNTLAPYIMLSKFDAHALKQLQSLSTVCEQTNLEGSFSTKSDYSVKVTLSAIPQNDGSHTFKVTNIRQVFWGIGSRDTDKLKSIEAKLKKQYPDVITDTDIIKDPEHNKAWEHWVYFADDASAAVSVTIRDPESDFQNEKAINNGLMKNQKCKVSVSLE